MKTSIKYILILSFISFASCSKSTEKKDEGNRPSKMKSSEEIPPENLITIAEAKEQIENFNRAHPSETETEYAMRTWISLEELKAYIRFVEFESAKRNIPVSGIDFIHTQHEKAEPGSENPDNKHYKLTLMMVPTYSDSNRHIAFDPLFSADKNPKSLVELLHEIPKTDSLKRENGAPPSSIANRLNTCPSICD